MVSVRDVLAVRLKRGYGNVKTLGWIGDGCDLSVISGYDEADRVLEFCDSRGIRVLSVLDEDYPVRFRFLGGFEGAGFGLVAGERTAGLLGAGMNSDRVFGLSGLVSEGYGKVFGLSGLVSEGYGKVFGLSGLGSGGFAPAVVFCKGDLSVLGSGFQDGLVDGSGYNEGLGKGKGFCSVVGSRRVLSPVSLRAVESVVSVLGERGWVLVSGLANGVDKEAHLQGLSKGVLQVGVLPFALNAVSTNAKLADRVVGEGGLLLSEKFPFVEVNKSDFVQRNRLVSVLSDKMVVVELLVDSGTMHTVRFGVLQGKQIFCVPASKKYEGVLTGNNVLLSDRQFHIKAFGDEQLYDRRPFALKLDKSSLNNFLDV